MTVIQERAFEIIKRLPDDKVYYVVKILEGIEGGVISDRCGYKDPRTKGL